MNEMREMFYYIHDKTRGYLGNAPIWWALNDQGYTAYILGAKRFTRAEALKTVQAADDLEMYSCDEIDKRLHLVFDSQDFHRLGTDEPCGWKGGYATIQSIPRISEQELVKIIYAAIRDMGDFCNAEQCAELATQEILARFPQLVTRTEGE